MVVVPCFYHNMCVRNYGTVVVELRGNDTVWVRQEHGTSEETIIVNLVGKCMVRHGTGRISARKGAVDPGTGQVIFRYGNEVAIIR